MAQFFEMTDQYAQVVDEHDNVIADAPIARFLAAVVGVDHGVFGMALRWMSAVHPATVLVERPPRQVTLGDHTMWLPWQCYLITPKNHEELAVRAFGRSSSLQFPRDELFALPLSGVDESGWVTDFTFPFIPDEYHRLGPMVDDIINALLESRTPDDLGDWSSLAVDDVLFGGFLGEPVTTFAELVAEVDVPVDDATSFTRFRDLVHELSKLEVGV